MCVTAQCMCVPAGNVEKATPFAGGRSGGGCWGRIRSQRCCFSLAAWRVRHIGTQRSVIVHAVTRQTLKLLFMTAAGAGGRWVQTAEPCELLQVRSGVWWCGEKLHDSCSISFPACPGRTVVVSARCRKMLQRGKSSCDGWKRARCYFGFLIWFVSSCT